LKDTIMAKAQADKKRADLKAAEARLAEQGFVDPLKKLRADKVAKRAKASTEPSESDSEGGDCDVKPDCGEYGHTEGACGNVPCFSKPNSIEQGIDAAEPAMVNSGFSIFNPRPPGASESIMEQTQEATPAVGKAEAKAFAEQKRLEREAARAEREAAAVTAKAAKLAKAQARAEKQAADIEAAQAAGRKYVGSMLALADRAKSYVKAANGQLRSTDALAEALDAVTPTGVIQLALALLGFEVNPYHALNVGQQSMNLRNRLRGAIKGGTVTIEQVIAYRDENGLATAGEAAAAKAAAREAKAAKKAQELADKEAAKAAKLAAKTSPKAEEPQETATA